MGTWVNLSFRVLKEFSSFSPHTKCASFLTSFLGGGTIVKNSWINIL